MAIVRVIKQRGQCAFLARNIDEGDWLFSIYKGVLYRLYDENGDLWMSIALRHRPHWGVVVTDVASGLMVRSSHAMTYDNAIQDVIREYEPIDRAMDNDFYKDAVKLCQAEYAELRERGILK